MPLTVNWGRDVMRDKIDISTDEFYQRLRYDHLMPKTAAPPAGIFEDLYRSLLTQHDYVVSIHLASALSATFSVAWNSAQTIDKERVHLVDSGSVSVGVGWLAAEAARMAGEGAGPDEIVASVEAMAERVRLFLTLDTLEYLQRGGRIGRASAFLGGLLNVKPLLQVKDGEVQPLERVRTRSASIRRLLELVEAARPGDTMAVVHGDCLAEAQTLSKQIADQHGTTPGLAEIGSVVGTHAGPGVLGIGFLVAS